MGLGKSLQVILFVYMTLYTMMDQAQPSRFSPTIGSKCIVVVAPKTVVPNWKLEFEKWIPAACRTEIGLRLFVVMSGRSRSDRLKIVKDWSKLGGVLITSYDCLKWSIKATGSDATVALKFKSVLFSHMSMLILDEAHLLKNHETQISAMFRSNLKSLRTRIALTGTPLQNNLKEYFNMSDLIAPGYLGTREYFESTFLIPIMRGQNADSTRSEKRKAEYCMTMLSETLDEFVLRKDNSLLKMTLPPLFEYVLFLDMTPFQKEIVLELFRNNDCYDSQWLMSFTSKVTQIFDHPMIFFARLQEIKRALAKGNAAILSGGVGINFPEGGSASVSDSNDVTIINKIKSEPIFDSQESESDAIIYLSESESESQPGLVEELEFPEGSSRYDWVDRYFPKNTLEELSRVVHSSKMKVVFSILEQCKALNEKVIVFSHLVLSLDYLGVELSSRGFMYCRLDGSYDSKAREKSIHDFNENPEYQVFLISTRAGGAGVNLVSANRVIILDYSWNPTDEEQAIGRVRTIQIMQLKLRLASLIFCVRKLGISHWSKKKCIYLQASCIRYIRRCDIQNPGEEKFIGETNFGQENDTEIIYAK
jgi:SNF2 family DNA or RNA helicase